MQLLHQQRLSLGSCRSRANAPKAMQVRSPACGATSRRQLIVLAHGHGHSHGGHPHGEAQATTATRVKPEKEKGFINEMRMVAMKLHTKEQAPKEGGIESPPKPQPWQPTREGYLRFLAESKIVFDALEQAVKDHSHPEYAAFQNTGLERSQALADDLAYFKEKYGLTPKPAGADSPGTQYAAKVLSLAKSDPQAFICHFYNFYFAHTAGGRMIGSKVSSMILDNAQLKFYQWEGDVNTHLDAVRKSINQLAESWSREQKDHCLAETQDSFKMSGQILRLITETA